MSSSALLLSAGISSHTINHFKPGSVHAATHTHTRARTHAHVSGMSLMKGWSAAIVTKQVASGMLQNPQKPKRGGGANDSNHH